MAFGAKLAAYDFGGSSSNLKTPTNTATQGFQPAYSAGARIFSNSWGASPPYNYYDSDCGDIDSFIYENNDALVLFAAGNDGDNEGDATISSPGVIKNGLTVGAAETSTSPGTAAYFSGRGPTPDLRLKPTSWAQVTRSTRPTLLGPQFLPRAERRRSRAPRWQRPPWPEPRRSFESTCWKGTMRSTALSSAATPSVTTRKDMASPAHSKPATPAATTAEVFATSGLAALSLQEPLEEPQQEPLQEPVTLLEVLHMACMARVPGRLLDVIDKHELLHK